MRGFSLILLASCAALLPSCGNGEESGGGAVEGPTQLIHQGEGFRLELRNEKLEWNEKRSARSLSGEVWLVLDADLPESERPTMLYGLLYLDVDRSREWSDIDGGTASILDDPLRDAVAVIPPDVQELKLGPITRSGVRPSDPPFWRAWVKMPDESVIGASIAAKAEG